MKHVAIHAEGLSKRYRLGERQRYLALRDVLAESVKAPARWFRNGFSGNSSGASENTIWSLRDVSFQIAAGERVGIIGRNGAGKTTLLKILSRVTRPTAGRATLHGRVGSLLEVGTGFHAELTGRENVFLSGAILGMRHAEIQRKFDEIAAFSGVEKFLDTPLKHYSSGMEMRLAFSVAAHLEPEILLVDEVLAVGDLEFQRKCLGKMEDVSRQGRTVVFISHQMNQIRRLCETVIWLDGGQVRLAGPAAKTIAAYETAVLSPQRDPARTGPTDNRFVGWRFRRDGQDGHHLLATHDAVEVAFEFHIGRPVKFGRLGVALFDGEQRLMWARAAENLQLAPGRHELSHAFPMLPLRPGAYTWHLTLWNDGALQESVYAVPDLIVATENHQHPEDEWNGFLNLPCEFRVREKACETACEKEGEALANRI